MLFVWNNFRSEIELSTELHVFHSSCCNRIYFWFFDIWSVTFIFQSCNLKFFCFLVFTLATPFLEVLFSEEARPCHAKHWKWNIVFLPAVQSVLLLWTETSVYRLLHISNLIPRAFSLFKMAVGENPGQGCWNTPRIVEYFVTWHMMKWLFWRLFPVWRPCLFSAIGNRHSNKTKTFHRVCMTKFWRTFGATLAALVRGFSDHHFERGEGPGD